MSVRALVKSIQKIMRKDVGVDGDAQRLGQLCWMFFLKIIDDQDQELEMLRGDYRSPIPDHLRWSAWAADPEGMTGDGLSDFVNNTLFPTLKSLPLSGKPGDRARVVRGVFEDAYNYMKSGQLLRQIINKINDVDFNDLVERQHFGDVYEQLLNDLQSAGNAGEYYTPRAVTAFMVDRIDPRPGEILFDPACGTGGFLTCSIRHMRDRYVKRPEDEQALQAGLRAVEKKPLPHMLATTNMLLHGVEDRGCAGCDCETAPLHSRSGCARKAQLSRQSEAARFTLADYAMVREGYLESDINRILNGPGHLLGSASTAMPDGAPANAALKSWENADGSSIVVAFESGVVVAKAQHGLR